MKLNHNDPSPEKLAVEKVLKAAHEPLTTLEIAQRAGVYEATARKYLYKLASDNKARNVGTQKRAKYVWRNTAPVVVSGLMPRFSGTYKPPQWVPARAGATDADAIGSVENGVVIPRTRGPLCIGVRP